MEFFFQNIDIVVFYNIPSEKNEGHPCPPLSLKVFSEKKKEKKKKTTSHTAKYLNIIWVGFLLNNRPTYGNLKN